MCAFMASGGIGFFSSVSVYNGFGLRNKLRDGPLHNEKARGIFFSPTGDWPNFLGLRPFVPELTGASQNGVVHLLRIAF